MRILPALVLGSLATLSCVLLAPGCSDAVQRVPGGDDDDDDPDPGTDASVRDARADASRDASADARRGEDAEALDGDVDGDADSGPPEPGSPCSPSGTRYERACGVCGLQSAVCGPNGVVSGYGACGERHPAFCAGDGGSDDGGSEDSGTDAEADASSDAGEDASGPVDPWQGYSIDLDGAIGQSRSVEMPDETGSRRRISVTERRLCPVSFPGTIAITDYAFVRIRNRTAQVATIELTVERGFGPTDAILSTYPTPPDTDADLLACIGSADRGSCPDPEGGLYGLACLTGNAALVLPAGAESYAYVGMAAAAWNGAGLNAKLTNLQ